MDTGHEDFELLRRQVEQLRRQNRWLAAFCGLIALALVLSFAVPLDVRRARRFELVDDGGRRQAMWRVRDDTAALILNDQAGRWRAVLSMNAAGPRLDLNSPLGHPLVSVSTPDLHPTLAMHDVEGRERVRIAVDSEGAWMRFFDEQGEAVATYPSER